MQDGEIAAAIAAGEPAGLVTAYDRYAPALYAYCRSLLAEPADAADAVQDTFIVAAAKAGGLRRRESFRPWLYAVARNECFGRLRAQGLSGPLDDAGEVTAGPPDPAAGPEREELHALVRAALAGLSPSDREVIELNLRHVLDGQDLADALGVSRNQAHALVSRARTQFEGSLGALLVARSGRGECPDLEDILADWDGNLTILLRKRINRHTENCEVCGDRKRRELSPAMLLSMLPMVTLPAGLRDQVFRLVTDRSPGGIGYRDLVVRRAEPFDRAGFPGRVDTPGRMYGMRTLSAVSSAAVIAAALLGVGTVFALDALHHKNTPPVSSSTIGPGSAPAPLASGSQPAQAPAGRHHPGSRGGGGDRPVTVAQPSPSPSLLPSQSDPGPAPANPSHPKASSSSPPPHHSHPPTPTPTTPPPSPGTLQASPGSVTLNASGSYTAQFTITAVGGPVSGFTIGDPAPANDLNISVPTDSLTAGESVTVTVTLANPTGLSPETDLSLDPGPLTVAVLYQPAG